MCPEKLDGPDGLAGAFQRRRKLSRLKLREHKDSANDRNKPIEAMLKPVAGKVVQPKAVNQERMKSATPWSKWSHVPVVLPAVQPPTPALPAIIGVGYHDITSPNDNTFIGYQNVPAMPLPGVGIKDYAVQGLRIRLFNTSAAQATALECEPSPLAHDKLLVFPNIGSTGQVSTMSVNHSIWVYCYDEHMTRVTAFIMSAKSLKKVPATTRHVMETHGDREWLPQDLTVWFFLRGLLCGAV